MTKHKQHRCSTCGKSGHNAVTCPEVALIRAKHGMATDEELVVVVTRVLYPDGSGPIVHLLQEDHGYIRVYPREAVDPRAHLGTPAEDVPYFKGLPEVATYMRETAENDGRGEMWHRPVLLSLVGAKRAFPESLFGQPHTEYA